MSEDLPRSGFPLQREHLEGNAGKLAAYAQRTGDLLFWQDLPGVDGGWLLEGSWPATKRAGAWRGPFGFAPALPRQEARSFQRLLEWSLRRANVVARGESPDALLFS